MSKLQPIVTLPEKWLGKAFEWGADFVAERARLRALGVQTRSMALAREGIEDDPVAQAMAKMDECAAAIVFGVDPDQCNWSLVPDSGTDFIARELRVDVKGSYRGSQYLIWPWWKNHALKDSTADILVFVRHDLPYFEIVGYVGKRYFEAFHHVAPKHHKLQEGTWHLHEDELWDLRELLPPHPPSQWTNIISCWPGATPTASAASTAT